MKKLTLLFALVIALATASFGQTALTQTTLSAALGASSNSSGAAPAAIFSQMSLASATGVTVAQQGQPVTFAYVDDELIGILNTVPGSTTVFNVLRAQAGTKLAPHASGAVVFLENVNPLLGGFSGSGGFQMSDPLQGTCTAANTLVSPWINVTNGRFWFCDSVSGKWIHGLSTGAITPAATAAAVGTTGQTFTLNGVVVGEPLALFSGPAPTSLCPNVQVRATAANQITLYFSTLTAAACTPAAGTYIFYDPLQ